MVALRSFKIRGLSRFWRALHNAGLCTPLVGDFTQSRAVRSEKLLACNMHKFYNACGRDANAYVWYQTKSYRKYELSSCLPRVPKTPP